MTLTGTPVDPRDNRAKRLRRAKQVALGLLVLMLLVYILATALRDSATVWRYVAAFAEAAMVGAMADWFAVVALFRYPLGIPIPHTAIIPTNKMRIAENLARFLGENFLSTPQLLQKLTEFDPATQLADWLVIPRNAASLGEHLPDALRVGLSAIDNEHLLGFMQRGATARLAQLDTAPLIGAALDVLTLERRHQLLLDEILKALALTLRDDAVSTKIAEMVTAEVKYLRYVGLDKVAGQLATRRIIAGIGRLIDEVRADEGHALRLEFDSIVGDFIDRLKTDPAFRTKADALKVELLAHPALLSSLRDVSSQLLTWLRQDLHDPDSSLRKRVRESALFLGDKLRADAPMRTWLNQQLIDGAPPLIERLRADVQRYMIARIQAWDAQELSAEFELNIGRDLQFVRINGTLVGGLIGLIIYSVTLWLRP